MRCLALAQAWQDSGGRAVFVWAAMPGGLVALLERENLGQAKIQVLAGSGDDVDATVLIARREQAEWIVVDGAHFGSDYLDSLRASGLKVLAVDDGGRLDRYPVDVLLNQNLAATPGLYVAQIDAETALLLGPRFALLRREFRAYRSWRRPSPRTPRRVLVSFGGGDEGNVTAGVLRNFARSGRTDFEVIALAGATNRHLAELRQVAAEVDFPCELRRGVDNVAEVMAWADVAITSAGSTVWELAAMGLPALVADIADGQLSLLGEVDSFALFQVHGVRELVTGDLPARLDALLERRGTETGLDAEGAARVVAVLRTARVRTEGAHQSLMLSPP